MKIYEEAFVKGIRKRLEERGIKHVAIARKAGIPEDTFSKIINRKRRLFADEAYKICKMLDCTIEEIIKEGKD